MNAERASETYINTFFMGQEKDKNLYKRNFKDAKEVEDILADNEDDFISSMAVNSITGRWSKKDAKVLYKTLLQAVAENAKYEIKDVEREKGGLQVVTLKVRGFDYPGIVSNYFDYLMNAIDITNIEDDLNDSKIILKAMTKAIENGKRSKNEVTVRMTMKKENGKWVYEGTKREKRKLDSAFFFGLEDPDDLSFEIQNVLEDEIDNYSDMFDDDFYDDDDYDEDEDEEYYDDDEDEDNYDFDDEFGDEDDDSL